MNMMKLHTLKVWNAVTALSHYSVTWTCGHLSGQVLDLWVKVKVKVKLTFWGHNLGQGQGQRSS